MKKSIYLLIVFCVLLAVNFVSAQDQASEEQTKDDKIRKEARPRISVKTFENPSMYYSSTIGTGVTDMLITKLVQSGRFNVIARHESFEEVKDEIDLGESGYIEEETKVEKGHVKGVEYILMGKVTNFGYKAESGGLGGVLPGGWGDVDVKKKKAVVWIDFRLVDAKTGETLIAESTEGVEKKSGISIDAGDLSDWVGRIDFNSDEFRDSMVGKATVKAVDEIAEKIIYHFPLVGVIIAVTGDKIVVDLGEGTGVKKGQRLKVVRENVVKNSQGDVVFREESEIGEIEITEIQLKSAMTKIISGCSDAKEGDLVKSIEDKKKKGDKADEDED